MTYRLYIDIPLDGDEDDAVGKAREVLDWLILSEPARADLNAMKVGCVNYRVGHDEDRQKSNYLVKTESGHVTNKKCKLNLLGDGA